MTAPSDGVAVDPNALNSVSTTALELGRNVSVRLALDDADTPDNGALVVLREPGPSLLACRCPLCLLRRAPRDQPAPTMRTRLPTA